MKEIDQELLRKYANGLCTNAEKELVQKWLDLEEESDAENEIFAEIDKEDLEKEIWQNIQPPTTSKSFRNFKPKYLYKAVACCLLAAFSYIIFHYSQKKNKLDNQTETAETYKEVTVPLGRIAHIKLADGTSVVLNAGTGFKYPTKFISGNPRRVYLKGEAYFQVATDARSPFIISTDQTNTEVLGTAFNINAYPEGLKTILTVEEGKVQFASKDTPNQYLTLSANQQGIIDRRQCPIQEEVSTTTFLAWKDDDLVFDNLILSEIATLLYRKYNVQINVEGQELKNKRFSGSYHRSSLIVIANDISQALHCQYKLDDNSLVFY